MKNFEHNVLPVTPEGVRQVPLFVVLDLDRTLFATNRLVENIWRLLPSFGVNPQEIEDLKAYEISQRGQQLDLIQEISRRFEGRFSVDDLIAQVAETRGQELLYEGVPELLTDLEQKDVPAMIMTYGSQASQEAKLKLTRLSLGEHVAMPFSRIVDHQRKAAWLAEQCVQTQDGRVVPKELYDREMIAAQQIIVVDDKKSNLEASSADGIGGILIDNDGTSGAGTAVRIGQVARILQDIAA